MKIEISKTIYEYECLDAPVGLYEVKISGTSSSNRNKFIIRTGDNIGI